MRQMIVRDSLEQLNEDMRRKGLQGFWLQELPPVIPLTTTVQPHLWRWVDIYESLVRAGEMIDLEETPGGGGSERRTARLINPGLRDRAPLSQFASHTIHVSVQYIKPGERARAHRHTVSALRFVVKGQGAYTTVDGQKCVMETGDLILTPQPTWHDHTNDSDEPVVWLDGLDMPVIQSLQQLMLEPSTQRSQAILTTSEEVRALYGMARPMGAPPARFVHYKWRDTYPVLQALAQVRAPDRFDGYLLEYRNPATGGPTMPTIQCALQLLLPRQETDVHRHTSTAIYHVVRGSGTSIVGDERFDWEQGDCFVVPLWYAHRHRNRSSSEEAVLFALSDVPVLKALELYREEVAAG